jgi:(4-(4-[2-(gamma-L-glutamylamino)ethyl]phenoxymethyl)furan-2-yl)methanamine synthase
MSHSDFIGWDIGGAHLKVASVNAVGKIEFVEQFASPLWQGLEQLEILLEKTIKQLPQGSHSHAFTITAELVDIFKDREEGVNTLIDVCEKNLGDNINLYATDEGILRLDKAREKINQIASANWHASTTYTASLIESGLFIDVGSTTADIIPFSNNKLKNRGLNDQSRLRFDELVYTGVIRTSLMALADRVPFNGEWQNIAAENFATTADVYRILTSLKESDDLMDAADGSSKDIQGSVRRLARVLGTDSGNSIEAQRWYKLAEYFEEMQLQLLTNAVLRVLSESSSSDDKIIGAGAGRFLIKKIAQRIGIPYMEFSDLCDAESDLQHKCNVCAPAVAIAQLNRQLSICP